MSDLFRFEVDGFSAPSPVMDGPQVWTFDATGVQIVSDVADSRFTLRAFDRVLEGANGFGVGVGGGVFRMPLEDAGMRSDLFERIEA